ncbi:MAG TPA: hypothetical protein VGB42_07070 [Candidatus Thermoplasmatota archaeon]
MAPVQKGTLGELAVANILLMESGGLLRCARPHADDHGQDWRMYAPGSAVSVGLQVKTAFALERGYELSYIIDLDQLPRDRRHLVVVCTVGAAGPPGIEDDAWWIPAGAMPRDRGGIYHFKTSLRPRSDNQWERYRIGRAGLAEAAWVTSASVGGPPAPSPRPTGAAASRRSPRGGCMRTTSRTCYSCRAGGRCARSGRSPTRSASTCSCGRPRRTAPSACR